MKRPLLAVCAWVVCLIALWQTLFPPRLNDHIWDGQQVYLYGQVASKQYKISDERETFILFLSDVTICSEEQVDQKSKTISQSLNHPFSWELFSKKSLKNFIKGMASEGKSEEIHSKIMVHTDLQADIGSYVLVKGKVSDFDLPRNPGEFNSRLYYATLDTAMQMFADEICWESTQHNALLENMWELKCKWSKILEDQLGRQQGSVLATILFGSKDRLDNDMKDLYQQSGISHILAISGLHMSLVGMGLFKLLRRLGCPFGMASIGGIILIVTYGVFTGAGASAYRAAGMFVIRMLGILLERSYDMLTSLGVLLLMMVLQNPLYLQHIGFLLSFGAMVGIGCVLPLLETPRNTGKYMEGWRKVIGVCWIGIKQSLIVSFSVTVTTLPIMVLGFYKIAPYSLLLNLVVIPLLPTLFLLGITLIIVSETPLASIICVLTELVLNLYSSLAELSVALPGSELIVGGVSTLQVLFYLLILGMLILCGKHISRQGCFKLLWIAILSMTIPVNFRAEICFLDVGQGDGIFVQTSTGKVYMIDGGSTSEKNVGKYTLAPFLKSKGIREIEGWIITHPDEDHCNGLREVLEAGYGSRTIGNVGGEAENGSGLMENESGLMENGSGLMENGGGLMENESGVKGSRSRVKRLLLPDVTGIEAEALDELRELASIYDIPVYYLSAGMEWEEGDVRFHCLHPAKGYEAESTNEYSVVLYLEMRDYSALLTGDIEGKGERLLENSLLENSHLGNSYLGNSHLRSSQLGSSHLGSSYLASSQLGSRHAGEEKMHVNLLKVAHHGSRYSTLDSFLMVIDADLAVVSCGENNRYGHPHEETLKRLEEDGSALLQTPQCGAITVKVGKEITIECWLDRYK